MEPDITGEEMLRIVVGATEDTCAAMGDIANSVIGATALALRALQPEVRAELAGRLTAALDGIMANAGRAHAAVWSTVGACESK